MREMRQNQSLPSGEVERQDSDVLGSEWVLDLERKSSEVPNCPMEGLAHGVR